MVINGNTRNIIQCLALMKIIYIQMKHLQPLLPEQQTPLK